jgi:hypothetical protein
MYGLPHPGDVNPGMVIVMRNMVDLGIGLKRYCELLGCSARGSNAARVQTYIMTTT